MQVSTMLLTAALTVFGTQNMNAATDGAPAGLLCEVSANYQSMVPADLPAQQGGVLRTINVKVGDQVKKGDVIATVDDELEKLTLAASEQRLAMAHAEADNDVNVRYARAAAAVYKAKYLAVEEAVERTPDAFARTERASYLLQWQQYDLQTEQAIHEQNLAGMSVRVREAENELAKHEVARRQIKAPVEGVIEEVKVFEGDWVRAGDPIVRLVQMDKLKINSHFTYGPLTPADVRGKEVLVTVPLARGRVEQFKGIVDSVSSDFGSSGEIRIIVEVVNRRDETTNDWLLMPGMSGTMQIQGIHTQ